MKKLIDIPEDIRWELEKQATEQKMNLKKFIEHILVHRCSKKKKSTQDVLDKYFKDSKHLYFQSSDALCQIEGDPYLTYEKTGRIELWYGGHNGQVCLLSTTDGDSLEALILSIIHAN